jgi:hypothetical protein
MSNLPLFMKNQSDNGVWKHLACHQQNWLEKKIRSLLKGESIAVRYVYGYLRYVDKDNRGFAYPAQATIAKAVKVSPRHVIRCLTRLVELDLIIRGKRAGHSYYIFTLPSSLKETKSPLETNLEIIAEEVKELKERALKSHLDKREAYSHVTQACHTNNNKINNKVQRPATPSSLKGPVEERPKKTPDLTLKTKPIKNPKDWFDWIEEKKDIPLSEKEKELVKRKQEELLNYRKRKFPHLPPAFLSRNTDILALSWVLKTNRNLTYNYNCSPSEKERTV